jgi:hypothetical protein
MTRRARSRSLRCLRRTNIYLGDEQCEQLDRLAKEAGVTRSEIMPYERSQP